jgi:hypothetical protein
MLRRRQCHPRRNVGGTECVGEGEESMGLHGLNKIESKAIELGTLDLYSESSYLLRTIAPMDDGLLMNTYLVDQEGLNTFFGSYGEHGEFVIELKRLEA